LFQDYVDNDALRTATLALQREADCTKDELAALVAWQVNPIRTMNPKTLIKSLENT
jgi:hypothetical protein